MEDRELAERLKGYAVYVIPYCHCDWAWTYSREWHEERYSLAFNEVLDILKVNPDYRWYIDSWSEMLAPFLKAHPDRVGELRERVREGRIAVTGAVTIPRPDQIGGETFIRNMVMGRRLFEGMFPGVDLSVLTLNDVTPGTAQMPQLLSKAGYRCFRFFRPLEALDQKGIPGEFVWEGPDGTRVICSRGMYGGIYRPGKAIEACLKDEVVARMALSPAPLLWWSMGADDIRPLRDLYENPVDVAGFISAWNRAHPGTPMRFATPVEFFRDLDRVRDSLPVVSGNLDPVGWSYWYGQIGNESLRVWRVRADDALVTVERFLSVADGLGRPYPGDETEALWYQLLRTTPHAVLWLFEEDYQEMLRWAKGVCHRAREIFDATLEDLSRRVRVQPGRDAVVVFNPSAWDRRDAVRMHRVFPTRGARSLIVRDSRGEAVPHQVLNPEPYEDGTLKEIDILFLAEVPATGYATYYIERHSDPPAGPAHPDDIQTVESANFRLSFTDGLLRAILDKRNGVEYGPVNDLRYYAIRDTGPYHYGPVTGIQEMVATNLQITDSGPIVTRLTIDGRVGEHGVEEEIVLYHILDRIDFRTTIDASGGNGFFRVDFVLGYDGEIVADAPFGVEGRDVRQEPYGSLERRRENVFYISHWADYADGEKGLALIGAPGVQGCAFDPETRTLGHTLLKTIVHPDRGWERLSTRLREGRGRQTFEYSLIPHRGDWRKAGICRRAEERRFPLIPVKVTGSEEGRDLPEVNSFLSVTPEHVLLSAFYREQEVFLVRVYETAGWEGRAGVRLPFAAERVREVDFTGSELARDIEVQDRSIRFAIRPYEIVTLRVIRQKETQGGSTSGLQAPVSGAPFEGVQPTRPL